jgi:uncharacterized delta-60 repeat protein
MGGQKFNVVRLTENGPVDTTFGTNGAFTDPTDSKLSSIHVRADGKLWLVGVRIDGNNMSFLHQVLLSADGVPDPTFGTNGVKDVQLSLASAGLTGTVMQGDKLVLYDTVGAGAARLRRVNADGSLDTAFGTGGVLTLSFKSANAGGVYAPHHLTVIGNTAYVLDVELLTAAPFSRLSLTKVTLP